MKHQTLLAVTGLLLSINLVCADSKRTAEFILSDPKAYQDTEVTLDVAMVKPVQWVSPLPEFAFFHALTIDRRDRKAGGHILVAVPSEESAAFAKKYGTDFEGRNNMTTLRGTLTVPPVRSQGRPRIYVVDTTGKLMQVLQDKKAAMPDGASESGISGGRSAGPRQRK